MDGQWAQAKMFYVANQHRNANQNHNERSSNICQDGYYHKDHK